MLEREKREQDAQHKYLHVHVLSLLIDGKHVSEVLLPPNQDLLHLQRRQPDSLQVAQAGEHMWDKVYDKAFKRREMQTAVDAMATWREGTLNNRQIETVATQC